MGWWRDVGSLSQGQLLIIDKAVSDIELSPQGATVWVQGCAGTGKTLVLTHVARRLCATRADIKITFLTYTYALADMIRVTVSGGSVPVRVGTYKDYLYKSGAPRCDVIVIDEIQDVSEKDLQALKLLCSHLIVAGDCEQRIYEEGCSESEIDTLIQFVKYRLVQLFRITKSIVQLAKKILPGTLLVQGEVPDGQIDVDVALRSFEQERQEARWVYDEALAYARPGYPSVIMLARHSEILEFCLLLVNDLQITVGGPSVEFNDKPRRFKNYNQVNAHFAHHGVPIEYLGNSIGELSNSDSRPLIYLTTYHSAKGLDFSTVFLPRLSARAQIGPNDGSLENALFFVATTRARERLVVTFTGESPHHLVELVPDYATRLTHHDVSQPDDDEGLF